MAHVRKQIRDAIATRLTGLTTTASRVFTSRMYPLDTTDLPGLCIYSGEEEVDNEGAEIGYQNRKLIVAVDCVAQAVSALDDTLDTIAAEVEAAMFTDPFFNNLIIGLELDGGEIEITDDIEKPVGSLQLRFIANYITKEGYPEVAVT